MVSYDLLLFMSKTGPRNKFPWSCDSSFFRRDHLRSTSGIICGSGSSAVQSWGSFPVWGSFAIGDHLRRCTVLRYTSYLMKNITIFDPLGANLSRRKICSLSNIYVFLYFLDGEKTVLFFSRRMLGKCWEHYVCRRVFKRLCRYFSVFVILSKAILIPTLFSSYPCLPFGTQCKICCRFLWNGLYSD